MTMSIMLRMIAASRSQKSHLDLLCAAVPAAAAAVAFFSDGDASWPWSAASLAALAATDPPSWPE